MKRIASWSSWGMSLVTLLFVIYDGQEFTNVILCSIWMWWSLIKAQNK